MMDPGSSVTGFQYLPAVTEGYGQLVYNGANGVHGFMACPSSDGGSAIMAIVDDAIPYG